RFYHFQRRYGESIEMFRKALDLNPGYGFPLSWAVDTYRLAGRPDEAFDTWLRDVKIRPWKGAENQFREAYKAAGWPAVWRVLLAVAPAGSDLTVIVVRARLPVHLALQEKEQALEVLELMEKTQ